MLISTYNIILGFGLILFTLSLVLSYLEKRVFRQGKRLQALLILLLADILLIVSALASTNLSSVNENCDLCRTGENFGLAWPLGAIALFGIALAIIWMIQALGDSN